ncbi:MAG: DUF7524 family protein [Halobacteriota archaeon]
MTPSLEVDINRRRLHDIEVDESFATDQTFLVEVKNHGEAVHVHLHLDDELSTAAHLEAGNHYVETDSTLTVEVAVAAVSQPVRGHLKVVTGYGAETQYVEVNVKPPVETKPRVDVDERLGKPKPPAEKPVPKRTLLQQLQGTGNIPILALGGLAILLALLVGVYASSPAVLLAVGVAIGLTVAATVLALR